MATYGDCTARARALLDDTQAAIYSDTVLLPLVNQAQGIFVSELLSAGISEARFVTTYSSTTIIPAGMTALTLSSSPALPSTIIVPDRLLERAAGASASEWIVMRGQRPLPIMTQVSTLVYWDWSNHQIQFVGATEAREVKLEYWGSVADFASGGGLAATTLPILGSLDILSALTAGLAATTRSQMQLAEACGIMSPTGITGQAGGLVKNYINTQVKAMQSEPMRRAPYAGIQRYPAFVLPIQKY